MDIEIRIDETANAAYVRFASGKVFKSVEEGEFTVDYNRAGKVLGVEILGLKQYVARNGGTFKIPGRFVARVTAGKQSLKQTA